MHIDLSITMNHFKELRKQMGIPEVAVTGASENNEKQNQNPTPTKEEICRSQGIDTK